MISLLRFDPSDPVDPGEGAEECGLFCAAGEIIGDPLGFAGDVVGAGARSVAGSAVDSMASAVSEGVTQVLGSLSTLWMNVETPAITSSSTSGVPANAQGGGAESVPGATQMGVTDFLHSVWWVGLGVAVLSLIALGGQMAVQSRRGEGERQLGRLGIVLVAVLLLGAATAVVGALAPAVNAGRGASPTVAFLQGSTWYLMAGLAVGSVLIAAIKMAWDQRVQPGKDLVRSLITLVVVSAVGLNLVMMLLQAGDSFAEWIVDRSLSGGTFAEGLEQMISTPEGGVLTAFVVIVVGILLILTSMIQIMLMVMRGAMLVLLAGLLPISAAATNTEQGKQTFQKACAWLLAFILYKPAAALVYATAFTLTGEGMTGSGDSSGLVTVLSGLMLMLLAVLTLPALLRFISPAVGAIGGGGGGAGAAMVAAAALPTGAAMIARGSHGGAGAVAAGGPSGSCSSSGSRGAAGAGGASSPGGPGGGSSSAPPGAGPSGGPGGGASGAPGGSGPGGGASADSSSGATGAQSTDREGSQRGTQGGAPTPVGAAAAPAGAAATGAAAAAAGAQVLSSTVTEAADTDMGGGPSGSGR
jgi:hypothetical protein